MSGSKNEIETKEQILKPSTPLKKNDNSIQYGGMSGDDVPLLTDAFPKRSKFSKFWELVCSLTIEPVIFSFLFAFVMNATVLSNMIMDKGCLYYFNYSREICQNLSGHPTEKDNVEILANNYSLYNSLTGLIGAFAMIFIAPYSDKYGRKTPLILAVLGVLVSDIGYMLCTYHYESPLEYLIIARIPGEMFGGFICILTEVFSHASEVSTEETRTLKYTCIEIALGLGLAFGSLAGGLLYQYYGYFYVYIASAAMHLFCAPWTLFMVQETTGLGINASVKEKFRDFFKCERIMSSVSAVFKKRKGHDRALLLMILATMCCYVITMEAYSSIGYVYVHHIFNWDPSIYSKVNTIATLCNLAFTILCVPILVGVFKAKDSVLGIIGTVSMMLKNLFTAFAREGHVYIYYIGLLSGFLLTLPSLSMRSLISKVVGKDELGQVFAFLATCESVVPTLGTTAITKIFNATMDVYPSVSYLTAVGLMFVPLLTLCE
ncbi:solute carrier family 46 member 3-like [Uloborus diversus]|uniref:solute carrier family 46 member 3-like n=1 Tax=Uloborus diversus TaxID=327109 RepID=UPI00240911F9|nr:solute carrier family 46 member 3-like [Uloborus diversus]